MVETTKLLALQQDMAKRTQDLLAHFQGQVEMAKGDNEAIQGHLAVYMHEASRRAEEFMHRVNDVITVLAAGTQEGKQDIVEKAQADGKMVEMPTAEG